MAGFPSLETQSSTDVPCLEDRSTPPPCGAFLCYLQMKEDRARRDANAKADTELRRELLARQTAHKQAALQLEVGGLACNIAAQQQKQYRDDDLKQRCGPVCGGFGSTIKSSLMPKAFGREST